MRPLSQTPKQARKLPSLTHPPDGNFLHDMRQLRYEAQAPRDINYPVRPHTRQQLKKAQCREACPHHITNRSQTTPHEIPSNNVCPQRRYELLRRRLLSTEPYVSSVTDSQDRGVTAAPTMATNSETTKVAIAFAIHQEYITIITKSPTSCRNYIHDRVSTQALQNSPTTFQTFPRPIVWTPAHAGQRGPEAAHATN